MHITVWNFASAWNNNLGLTQPLPTRMGAATGACAALKQLLHIKHRYFWRVTPTMQHLQYGHGCNFHACALRAC